LHATNDQRAGLRARPAWHPPTTGGPAFLHENVLSADPWLRVPLIDWTDTHTCTHQRLTFLHKTELGNWSK